LRRRPGGETVAARPPRGAEAEGTAGMDETGIDRDTMGRLAGALGFIRSSDDPVVAALRQAAASGAERDVKRARSLFLKLKPAERRAALAAISD
jgi:hypothetical protein